MNEQMRILIGYDGSTCADSALEDLRRAGLPRNAEAVILTVREVWLPDLSVMPSVASANFPVVAAVSRSGSPYAQVSTGVVPVSEAYSLAQKAKACLQSRFPSWAIRVEESSGSPSHEILKKAAEMKPHLIVVGCQGRSALGGFLLGSVSQKVVNEARSTVRVSRGSGWKDGAPVRILIGLDGTPNSANCLIKNLLESESLPQIRNLLEMREINPAVLTLSSGVENEADDEGTETDCGSDGWSVPQGAEEREGGNSE